MRSNRSRRLLALLLVPACIGLAACGGGDEPPDTEVIVPEPTPQAGTADSSALPSADGYLVAGTRSRLALRTVAGDAVFHVAAADRAAIGIDHLLSHAGARDIGFRIFYEKRDGKFFVKSATEIPPPF